MTGADVPPSGPPERDPFDVSAADPAGSWPGLEQLPSTPPEDWPTRSHWWRRTVAPPPETPGPPPPTTGGPDGPDWRPWVVGGLVVVFALLLAAVLLLPGNDETLAAGPSSTSVGATSTTTTTSTTQGPTSSTAPTSSTTSTTSTTTTIPDCGDVDEAAFQVVLGELMAFVETERGLTFLDPVDATPLCDRDFQELQQASFDEIREAVEAEEAFLKSIGAIPSDADYVAAMEEILVNQVLGVYDPEAAELTVRAETLDGEVRAVVVHELTHAIDDQNFGFDRPEYYQPDTELGFGFDSVIEGDAQRIQRAYVESIGGAFVGPGSSQGTGTIEDFAATGFNRQYVLGLLLLDDVFSRGGQAELDLAFTDPPSTSEQVRSPEKYAAREPRIEVATPEVPGDPEILGEGVVGELTTQDILEPVVGPDDAEAAARGWGGDWYVMWGDDAGRTCTRTDYAMDTSDDLGELLDAFVLWVDAAPPDGSQRSVEMVGDELVRVTSCVFVAGGGASPVP